MTQVCKVVDISHHNEGSTGHGITHPWPVTSDHFNMMAASGIVGVILKGTQGVRGGDPTFHDRLTALRATGLMPGAYDFNTGDPVRQQVDFFFDFVRPDDTMLCALDFEDNEHSEMSLDMAREYLEIADARLGRKFWIYSGNRIKHCIIDADDETRAFFASHPLWGCQYGAHWKNQDENHKELPWVDGPTLWQFAGDGTNSQGIVIPGLLNGNTIDMNAYGMSDADFATAWVS